MSKKISLYPIRRRNFGFSLIEVLVAMLLLAIGVLGAVGMQLNALKYSQTSTARTQAAFLAYTIVDMMRANSAAAVAGNYNIALDAEPGSSGSVADQDLVSWTDLIKTQLPDGKGSVARKVGKNIAGQSVNIITVTLEWSESRVGGNSNTSNTNGQNPDRQQFVFVTEL